MYLASSPWQVARSLVIMDTFLFCDCMVLCVSIRLSTRSPKTTDRMARTRRDFLETLEDKRYRQRFRFEEGLLAILGMLKLIVSSVSTTIRPSYHGYKTKVTFLLQLVLDHGQAPAGGFTDRLQQQTLADTEFYAYIIRA